MEQCSSLTRLGVEQSEPRCGDWRDTCDRRAAGCRGDSWPDWALMPPGRRWSRAGKRATSCSSAQPRCGCWRPLQYTRGGERPRAGLGGGRPRRGGLPGGGWLVPSCSLPVQLRAAGDDGWGGAWRAAGTGTAQPLHPVLRLPGAGCASASSGNWTTGATARLGTSPPSSTAAKRNPYRTTLSTTATVGVGMFF